MRIIKIQDANALSFIFAYKKDTHTQYQMPVVYRVFQFWAILDADSDNKQTKCRFLWLPH